MLSFILAVVLAANASSHQTITATKAAPAEAVPSSVRPSILVIRADQLRASAIGCYDEPLAITPNIDSLAAGGVKYTQAYATEPVCSAHRTTFDTGLHTHANPNGDKLHPSDRTIHGLLQDFGYRTWHVGKHHKQPTSCNSPQVAPQMVPSCGLMGLDYHAGHVQQHTLVDSFYYRNGVVNAISAGPWRPQAYVDEAIGQLDIAASTGQRFYGVLDLEPPHTPYGDIVGTQWDVFSPGDIPAPPNVPAGKVPGAEIQLALYYSMVFSVDDMVGQIMAHLAATGLDERTIIIFTTDHGAHVVSHGFNLPNNQKRSMYQEAIHVPYIVWRKNHPEAGTVNDDLWGTVDPKIQIMEWVGLPVPPTLHGNRHIPGVLFFEQLKGNNTPTGTPWVGIVTDDGMKYARAEGVGPWVMFDTWLDPWEMTNLVGTGDPREALMDDLLNQAASAVGYTVEW